ncbi:MAG: ABC transporter ATP-binding protein [Myxococcales bacterium]|nr:ABC transporter ATP-binding protein [Myxococcales bacterium]
MGLALGAAGAHAVWRRTRRTPTTVARRGVARTFQNIRLFHNMTVLENVLVAMDRHLGHRVPWTHASRLPDLLAPAALLAVAIGLVACLRPGMGGAESGVATGLFCSLGAGIFGWLWRIGRRGSFSAAALVNEAVARTEALELLRFVGLDTKAGALSKNLAYGEQRRLEIARALATRPKLLLLDEPAAGMNPSETVSLMALIRQIRDTGVTVLLIEHHMRVVMGISDRITVLVYGKRIAEGTPDEIRANPAVIEAYLGAEDASTADAAPTADPAGEPAHA